MFFNSVCKSANFITISLHFNLSELENEIARKQWKKYAPEDQMNFLANLYWNVFAKFNFEDVFRELANDSLKPCTFTDTPRLTSLVVCMSHIQTIAFYLW